MKKVNFFLIAWIVALNFFQLFILPYFLLPINFYYALLLLPIAFFNNMHWALIHEGIHSVLFDSPKANKFFSRTLSIYLGSSFRILRLGHLMHHKYDPDRPEFYNSKKTPMLKANLSYFFQLLGGLYLIELVVPILFLLPRKIVTRLIPKFYSDEREDVNLAKIKAAKGLTSNKAIKEIRQDAFIAWIKLSISFFLYLPYWPIFLLILISRGFQISFMDNIYHYATPIVEKSKAHNLKMPKFLEFLFLNANYHGFHHHYPKVPWYDLPKAFKTEAYDFSITFTKASHKQWLGAIESESLGLRDQ